MTKLKLALIGLPVLGFMAIDASAAPIPHIENILVPLLVIIILVLLNGLFVAAEFAIIAVRPTQAERITETGHKAAQHVRGILGSRVRKDRYIAAAQLGITLASLGLGMYGEAKIAHYIEPYLALLLGVSPNAALVHSFSFVIALSMLTYLHVVVGEMLPKSWALAAPQQTVLAVSGIMRLTEWVFSVPVRVLNGIGVSLLKIFHMPKATEGHRMHSLEELEQIVTESMKGGVLTENEEHLLLNILEFGERRISQVMIPRNKLQAIQYDADLSQIIELVSESQFSRFPVCKGDLDHIVGVIHVKDLIHHQIEDEQANFDLSSLIRTVPYVPEKVSLARLLSNLKYQRLHMAIVIDEYGGTAGAVTLEDLVEEIVGDVQDEFDTESAPLLEISPGVLEIAGHYLVDDLDEYVDWGDTKALPDVDTVSGLLVTWLGHTPLPNETFTYDGRIRFTVLEIERRTASRIRVEYLPDDSGPTAR